MGLPATTTAARVVTTMILIVGTTSLAGDKKASAPSAPNFATLRQKCEKDHEGCFEVANALYYGEGAKQDKAAGIKIAASLCKPDSANAWACTVYAKSILEEKTDEALKWLEWACRKQKLSEACLLLSSVVSEGQLVAPNPTFVSLLLLEGCKQEYEVSSFPEKAVRERVDKWATARCCYVHAVTTATAPESGEEMSENDRLKRACDLGLADACIEVANRLARSVGYKDEAGEWRKKGLALKRTAGAKGTPEGAR